MGINWTEFFHAWDQASGTAMVRNPPATDEAIAAAQARLGSELPADFAAPAYPAARGGVASINSIAELASPSPISSCR